MLKIHLMAGIMKPRFLLAAALVCILLCMPIIAGCAGSGDTLAAEVKTQEQTAPSEVEVETPTETGQVTPEPETEPKGPEAEYAAVLSDITSSNPELAVEIERLPELQDGCSEADLEAVKDIADLCRNGDAKTAAAFAEMLDEGIPGKRAYCTPLQALLWIAYDRDFDNGNNPLADYDLEGLLDEAWILSSTSDNYNSEEWQDLDTVASRLNSPAIITKYGLDVISYDDELFALWEQGTYPPSKTVQQVFEQKKGICNEQSRFYLYCLMQNGYAYDNFDDNDHAATALWAYEQMEPPVGHVTCLYQDGTDDYFIIDIGGNKQRRGIVGPFSSIEEAAAATRSASVGYCLINPKGGRTFCTS